MSVLVPMYNEEEVLETFFSRVIPILETCTKDFEIVAVNDGSTDGTLLGLLALQKAEPRLIIVDLTRNFGKEQALTAGLEHCRYQTVLPIDSDLQDPPEVIPQFVEKWQEGYDMIFGTRCDRSSDSWFKRTSASLFYRFYNAIADVPIPANTGDFRLMDRVVVDAVLKLKERNRFMKGLFGWVGFHQCSVEYSREVRVAGSTKWRLWQLWNFALDGITASTTMPLRLASYFGLLVSGVAFSYALFLILRVMVWGRDVPGYASLMVGILLLGGVQLISLGVIGEYLGRLYQETRRRPLFLVREIHRTEPS